MLSAPIRPTTETIAETIADLLYHEATFLSDLEEWAGKTLHATALQAATIALKANVKKLILGHFSTRYKELEPFLQEARAVFPETELASDGLRFSVTSPPQKRLLKFTRKSFSVERVIAVYSQRRNSLSIISSVRKPVSTENGRPLASLGFVAGHGIGEFHLQGVEIWIALNFLPPFHLLRISA